MGEDPGAHRHIAHLRFSHQHQRRRTIRDRRGIGRRDRALLLEGRFQVGDLVGSGITGLLVSCNLDRALAGFQCHRRHFPVEGPVGLGLQSRIQRGDGIGILFFAGELVLLGAVLGERAHEAPFLIGILQSVHEHVVHHRRVPDSCAAAHFGYQIGGVGHALHAARDDDFALARTQRVHAHHDGLHARPAHLVDGRAGHLLGQACAKRRLPCGCLAETCGQDAAHQNLADLSGIDTSPVQRRLDGNRTQLWRRGSGQLALKSAHGRACGTDDDDGIGHGVLLQLFPGNMAVMVRRRKQWHRGP